MSNGNKSRGESRKFQNDSLNVFKNGKINFQNDTKHCDNPRGDGTTFIRKRRNFFN